MNRRLMLILTVVCLIGVLICYPMNGSELTIDPESSWFMNFYVEDNIVHIRCVLRITNHTNRDLSFFIKAESEEDVKTGLLLNRQMRGINGEDGSGIFSIGGGETRELTVDFQGEFGGYELKKDRLLPDEIILEICTPQ